MTHQSNTNDEFKIGVGFLIPATATVAFFFSVFTENYLLGIFLSVAGILVWFIYTAIMQTSMPNVTGNIIILFGSLLSVAVFLNYGLGRNMFGGFNFNLEGVAVAAIFLLFSVLLGVLFKDRGASLVTPTAPQKSPLPNLPIDTKEKEDRASFSDEPGTSYNNVFYDEYEPEDYEGYYPEYYENFWGEEDEE
ncbi:MAG: hypothetical protein QF847_01760 [Candidatus Marinimicrobia bacterium]|jgi:hypothetical protein|nr:hypothetical protein [Candidatus Neomarinimicrobiota bacterium]|tara:strand:- start:29154 stop:29729 length:576 start_codon:yes stop_codon:yes gene_type:complete